MKNLSAELSVSFKPFHHIFHRRALPLFLLALLAQALFPPAARSQQFWDPDGATLGSTVPGNWDTITPNWTTAPDSGVNTTWVQGNPASFILTNNLTVTLTEPITIGGITVSGTNGTLTLGRTAGNAFTLVGPTILDTGGRGVTIPAPITGPFDLTRNGAGTVTVSGTNTYSGGTSLTAGTTSLGISSDFTGGVINWGPFGTGPVNVNAAATISPSGTRILHNVLNLNAGLTIGGSAAFTITNGGFAVLGGNRTVTVNNSADTTLQNLSDDGSARTLTKAGSGRLVMMTGGSTYLGGITASAGTLAAGSSTPFPTNANNQITINASTLDLNGFNVYVSRLGGNANGKVLLGTNTLTAGNDASSAEFSGVISGTGGYVKVGNISQVLSGSNTFTGGITISAGALYLSTNGVSGSALCLAAGGNIITITNTGRIGANRAGGSFSIITNNIVLATVGPTAGLDPANGGTFFLTGQVSGSGGFLRYSQGGGIAVLSGNNTFTGGVEMDARTLGIGHRRALGTGPFIIGNPIAPPSVTIAIATAADLAGANAITNVTTVNQSFTVSATNNFELSGPMTLSNAVTITTIGDSNIKFSGNIDGPGAITKMGATNLILSGANTFAGPTLVVIGGLFVNNTTGSGTGTNSVTVFPTAILGGGGTVAGPVTVQGGGIVAGGSPGKLTLQSGLDMSAGGTENWYLANPKDNSNGTAGTDFDQVALTDGAFNLGPGSTLALSFSPAVGAPSTTNTFWRSSHTWTVLKISGTASNVTGIAFSSISTPNYSVGSFTNTVALDGSILLSYDAVPRPVISSVTRSGGNVNISFLAANGSNYRVEYTTSLTSPNWQLLQTVTGTGTTVTVQDTSPTDPQRFYRVVLTD